MKWTTICEHGKLTLRCGKETHLCKTCDRHKTNEAFAVPDVREQFNHGLGCMVSGTRGAEKIAKQKGLRPIGDAKPSEVFRQERVDTITPILEEGRKRIHNLGVY